MWPWILLLLRARAAVAGLQPVEHENIINALNTDLLDGPGLHGRRHRIVKPLGACVNEVDAAWHAPKRVFQGHLQDACTSPWFQ